MSNAIFPTLPGLVWDFKRAPLHKTTMTETVSGREYRARRMAAPRYLYKATYEFLRDGIGGADELRTLMGFFNQRSGQYDSWLFSDPSDKTASSQNFGIGDGTSTVFQLVRTLGGNTEPVYAVNGAPLIYRDGALLTPGTHYSINANAGVTFVTAPTAGDVLTWIGNFYWRCRFVNDQMEFAQFSNRLWTLKACDFITVKP